jgi:hypothetical protein
LAALETSGQQPGDFLARHVSGEKLLRKTQGKQFQLDERFRLLSAYYTVATDARSSLSLTLKATFR